MFGRRRDCKQLFEGGRTLDSGAFPLGFSAFLLLLLILIMILFQRIQRDQEQELKGRAHV